MTIIKPMVYFSLVLTLAFLLPPLQAKIDNNTGLFSGRVSKLNSPAELLRVKIDFSNIRYLNKGNRVEFWLDHSANLKCEAVVMGKTTDYILLKVPSFKVCNKKVPFTAGSYIKIFSRALVENITIGQELVSILLKKRLANESKLERVKKELDTYVERVEAMNDRYEVLKEKLDLEWQKELTYIENDKAILTRNYHDLQIRINEIDRKLERYKIADKNLKTDRWSLDPELYITR